jgi:predicted GIY-YIG superfamily endonuclease
MSYYVYILKCIDESLYVGSTNNIKNRMISHKNGLVDSTKNKRPVKLNWYCCFQDKDRAIKFEKYLKIGSGFSFSRRRLV